MKSSKVFLGILYVILSAFCYGFIPIFTKFAYQSGINTSTLLFLRFFVTFILFFCIIGIKKIKFKLTLKQVFQLFILGGVCYLLISSLYISSLKYISAGLAALLMYTYPIFVTTYTCIVQKETMSMKTFISLLFSIAGIGLAGCTAIGSINKLGIIFALGASVASTAYVIIGTKTVKKIDPIIVSAFTSLFAFIGITITTVTSHNLDFNFNKISILWVLGLALISTVLALLFFFSSLELLDSTKTSVLATLEPLFAIILSSILLRESLSHLQYIGALLLIAGIVGVTLSKNEQSNSSIDKFETSPT